MLSIIVSYIQARLRTERGQDLIEYALLGGLIAVAIIGAVAFFGTSLDSMAQGIGRCIDFAPSPCDPGIP